MPARHPWFVTGCLSAVCLTLGVIGCSGGGGSASGTAAHEPARAAVVQFLDAIKRGDEARARDMLTAVARTKTQEMGISVAPPVNDSATYELKESESVSDTGDLVHVGTAWTDVDSEGFKTTDNVVWVVRLDPEGWRVVGMAMRVFDDLPPLLLNFEDPEDMLAKQEMVAAELQKRAEQAASAGQQADKAGQQPRTADSGASPAAPQSR